MLSLLMQDFNDDFTFDSSNVEVTFSPIFVVLMSAIVIALAVFMIAAMWKMFTKAGEPGWYALIPILNTYTLIKIVGRPGWWLLLTFVPCVSFVVSIILMLDLAKAFGKDTGFGLGLVFLSPIFIAILGWGSAEYIGPPNAVAGGYGGTGGHGSTGGYGGTPGYGVPSSPAPGTSAWGSATGATTPAQPAQPAQPADPFQSQQPAAQPPQAAANPPAGWYPDPSGSGQRYWDGNAWTEHHAD